jgi:hypothetical protein
MLTEVVVGLDAHVGALADLGELLAGRGEHPRACGRAGDRGAGSRRQRPARGPPGTPDLGSTATSGAAVGLAETRRPDRRGRFDAALPSPTT